MRLPRLLTTVVVLAFVLPPVARADDRDALIRAYIASRIGAALPAAHERVPSFSRQTGLACSSCHYQFLTLTPFGREFKLNGYTLTTQKLIVEKDKTKGETLHLSPIPLLAAMLQASFTHIRTAVPDAQNGVASLPQQLSAFLAGEISSKIGIFSQLTYSGADNAFGIDNIDLRFADKKSLSETTDIVYGVTLNNNPSVQDLWNTTPAWGFPFASSDAAPTGLASTLIDGGLAQQALGVGAYTMLGGLVYTEFSLYRSALQGKAVPDSFAISSVAPYWRVALQKAWPTRYVMVGTYGLHANRFPGAVVGPTDHYTDIGLDAQYETKAGAGNVVVRGTWIHERQTLDATFAAGGSANAKNTLKTLRVNSSYYPSQWLGVSAGFFQTTGTADSVLYPPAPVTGSATGSPKTSGFLGEVDLNPSQNVRVGAQYVGYGKFNGLGSGYDGAGRNASDNNALYLLAWVVF